MTMWTTLIGVILIFVSLVVPSTHEGVYNIGLLQSQMMIFQAGLVSLLIGAVARARDMIIASIERDDPADDQEGEDIDDGILVDPFFASQVQDAVDGRKR